MPLGFILSAIIDNLTATIVLVTLLRKLIQDKNERLWYAALIVIAANAGGAWAPIGGCDHHYALDWQQGEHDRPDPESGYSIFSLFCCAFRHCLLYEAFSG